MCCASLMLIHQMRIPYSFLTCRKIMAGLRLMLLMNGCTILRWWRPCRPRTALIFHVGRTRGWTDGWSTGHSARAEKKPQGSLPKKGVLKYVNLRSDSAGPHVEGSSPCRPLWILIFSWISTGLNARSSGTAVPKLLHGAVKIKRR